MWYTFKIFSNESANKDMGDRLSVSSFGLDKWNQLTK